MAKRSSAATEINGFISVSSSNDKARNIKKTSVNRVTSNKPVTRDSTKAKKTAPRPEKTDSSPTITTTTATGKVRKTLTTQNEAEKKKVPITKKLPDNKVTIKRDVQPTIKVSNKNEETRPKVATVKREPQIKNSTTTNVNNSKNVTKAGAPPNRVQQNRLLNTRPNVTKPAVVKVPSKVVAEDKQKAKLKSQTVEVTTRNKQATLSSTQNVPPNNNRTKTSTAFTVNLVKTKKGTVDVGKSKKETVVKGKLNEEQPHLVSRQGTWVKESKSEVLQDDGIKLNTDGNPNQGFEVPNHGTLLLS